MYAELSNNFQRFFFPVWIQAFAYCQRTDDRDRSRLLDLVTPAAKKCNWSLTFAENPSIYWINLESNIVRKQYMENKLKENGFLKQTRIVAITPNSPQFDVIKLQKPCKRNTDKDIAVILSHLTAMYYAVHDTSTIVSSKSSSGFNIDDYALILEDDVDMLHQLNFTALIQSAPKDFGILQLVTSNEEAINSLWSSYKEMNTVNSNTIHQPLRSNRNEAINILTDLTINMSDSYKKYWVYNPWTSLTRDKRTILYWSTQAYLINKKVIKPFIDDVIVVKNITSVDVIVGNKQSKRNLKSKTILLTSHIQSLYNYHKTLCSVQDLTLPATQKKDRRENHW